MKTCINIEQLVKIAEKDVKFIRNKIKRKPVKQINDIKKEINNYLKLKENWHCNLLNVILIYSLVGRKMVANYKVEEIIERFGPADQERIKDFFNKIKNILKTTE